MKSKAIFQASKELNDVNYLTIKINIIFSMFVSKILTERASFMLARKS